MEWSTNDGVDGDGSPSLPTDMSDFMDIFVECQKSGMNVPSHVIAKLACRMIPRDQVIEIIKHMYNLSEDNVHESTMDYFAKKYPRSCGQHCCMLTQAEVDVMVEEFGKEELVKAYNEKRKETGFCFVCGRVDGLRRCSSCKERKYCSVKCQKKDWKKHKVACLQK